MKYASIIVAFLVSLMPLALATSRIYSTIDQLIASSDIIAVVTVDKSNEESLIKRSKSQPFGFASSARIQNTIKGNISDPFLIHHMSGLDDCLFQQGPGDYLVFLRRQGDKYIPSDGWPSSKRIVEKQVAGWSDMRRFEKDSVLLQTVIEYIKTKR
jgi:hypothetical protein